MFTVKVVRPNGNEDLYEAREITKEPNGLLMQIDFTDTIYLAEGGRMLAWDALANHRTMKRSEPCETATAYVMNRFGSTVATYAL